MKAKSLAPESEGELILLIPLKKAAPALSISKRNLEQKARDGEIPSVRIGRRLLFSPIALQAWIEKQQNRGGENPPRVA